MQVGASLKASDLEYELPPELIAQEPIEPRDASRLMVLSRKEGSIEHGRFRELTRYLRAGDVLVCNDSRVIRARLRGQKVPTGGRVEILLLARKGESEVWEALIRGRKVRGGMGLSLSDGVEARVLGRAAAGSWLLGFSEPIEPHLAELGEVPLPPYIHRQLAQPERYQTVYSRPEGSVAAPTAGLHFTAEFMEELRGKGVEFAFLTLHIGWDTFRPVREEAVEEHRMHAEYGELSPEVAEGLNRARAEGRRIIAVGTTAVRLLETAAQGGEVHPYRGRTSLFIYPGYEFRAVEALLTNFHLPCSTLLALVYAFAGKPLIDRAYQEAIRERYRFYSFGDCMFIL